MKYCKDCKWCQLLKPIGGADYSKCLNPAVNEPPSISLVTGNENVIRHLYCDSARLLIGKCGPNAMLFEPTDLFADEERDRKIDAAEEARRDRAESNYRDSEQEFESEMGARP